MAFYIKYGMGGGYGGCGEWEEVDVNTLEQAEEWPMKQLVKILKAQVNLTMKNLQKNSLMLLKKMSGRLIVKNVSLGSFT